MRKQNHLFDRRHSGQQHDNPVDAHTHAPSRWQSVFERAHIVVVDVVGLGVTPALELGLGFETAPLFDRVVELAERVRDLAAADQQLEAFGERRIVTMRRASGDTSIG